MQRQCCIHLDEHIIAFSLVAEPEGCSGFEVTGSPPMHPHPLTHMIPLRLLLLRPNEVTQGWLSNREHESTPPAAPDVVSAAALSLYRLLYTRVS